MAKMITYIAGVNHRPGARERLAALPRNQPLNLVPEPLNIYDKNAVAVYHGGVHLGYVPAADAITVSTALRARLVPIVSLTRESSTTEITIRWGGDVCGRPV